MLIKRKVRELTNADVRKISLVDRGATRIPFRVIKADKSHGAKKMIDLGKVFKRDTVKKSAPSAVISALVFPSKPENIDQVLDTVKKSGFSIENLIEEKDGTFVVAQDGYSENDTAIVKMDGDLAVVLKGFDPYSDDLENFNDLMGANSFYSSLATATQALTQAICQQLYDGDDPDTVASGVQSTLADFNSYVTSLIKGLPVTAFKLDKQLSDLSDAFKVEKIKKAEEDAVIAGKEAEAIAKAAKSKNAEMTKPDGVDQADWDAMSDDEKKKAIAKDTAKKEDKVDDVAKVIDVEAVAKAASEIVLVSLKSDLARLTESVNTLVVDQKALAAKTEEAVQKSEAIAKRVGGTVLAGVAGDERPTRVETRKSEVGDGPFNGSYDSAFAGKRKA